MAWLTSSGRQEPMSDTDVQAPDTTLTWAVIDAVTWRRVAASSWLSRESAEAAIEGWHKRAAKGKRPDLDLGGMVLIPVPDELVRRAERGLTAEKDYERAQTRTFELSEELQRLREESQPLRDLLRRVTVHCIPNFYEMRGESMDEVWQDVRKATT